MTSSQEHELHLLNDLIVATLNSASGYQKVAAAMQDNYALMFSQHASVRHYLADRFQEQVEALGGTPAHHRSILAAAHRAAMGASSLNVNSSFDETTSRNVSQNNDPLPHSSGDSREDGGEDNRPDARTLSHLVAHTESTLSQQFEAALASERLSQPNRELVDKGYRLVKVGHEHALEVFKNHGILH